VRAYVDTSVLAAAYCDEPGTRRADRALRECEPAISSLTRVEFSSAVARKAREGSLTRTEATRIVAEFQTHVRADVFEPLSIDETHYALANDWIDSGVTALRTLDALHLAVAHAHGIELITADKTLAKAGRQLGCAIKAI
jgi:predicted nucleic acid-binding protein